MKTYLNDKNDMSAKRLDAKAYNAQNKIIGDWEACPTPENYCGNFGSDLKVGKTGKLVYRRKNEKYDFDSIGVYAVLPSALWLYRLACCFCITPEFPGPEGYKCVWGLTLRHKPTGAMLHLYDYKGAFSCGASVPSDPYGFRGPLPAPFRRAALKLLNHLMGDKCLHPYDGTVAGKVA